VNFTPHNGWRARLTIAALGAVVPFAAVTTAAQAAPSAHARLASVAKKAPKRKVTAIVQFKATYGEKQASKLVRRHGGKVVSRVPLIHGLAVKLPAKQARTLAKNHHVAGLTLNSRVHSTGLSASQLGTSYPKTISADKLWSRGITGRGVGVAVLDTGVAGNQPDFAGRVVANVVTSPGAKTAADGFGHGTHVAGIIAGNSFNRPLSDPFYGKYVGVAPEANLIAIKASDDAGNATVLDVINGIAFAVDHKNEFNIRVLNLSVSSGTPQSYKTDPLDAAVEYAWQKGITVVVAAGNRGNAADAVQYGPANDPYVISVGGVDETTNSGQGSRADWSSLGVTQDGLTKPDVMAPGAHIVSVLAPSSAFQALCPTCAIGGSYFKAGGTSMAAPVVAGAAALMLQARPTLTPDQVKALLMGTDHAVSGANAGEINVEKAVFTWTYQVPRVNVNVVPNALIDAVNRAGIDISNWTKSSWSVAQGDLAAGWAKSSWSCVACDVIGDAIETQSSTWSKSSWSKSSWSQSTWSSSTWSSVGEDASPEVAQYAAAAEQAQDERSLDAPIPADAEVPTDEESTPAPEPTATVTATPEPAQ
jgi:serine protease AprX